MGTWGALGRSSGGRSASAAEQGLGVHELTERDAQKDRETWAGLLDWLENNRGGFTDFEYALLQDRTG